MTSLEREAEVLVATAPQPTLDRGDIMVVDDNPSNLKLMESMLRTHGYAVRSFPRGRLALAAAENEPPDVILLDVNMPETDGYEVCQKLKANDRLCGIPVIFLSALNTVEDKLKGFRAGGVDYISKPFRFEEVRARVDTQLKLLRAQRAEHELLQKTLGGVVKALWELIQISSPMLARRSTAVRDIVLWMTREMRLANPWQYDLAATLCLIGCILVPEDVFLRAHSGDVLSPEEERMYSAHPERGASLLANIPRLEAVAEMLRRQNRPEAPPPVDDEAVKEGAYMLHLALELDRRIYRGVPCSTAIAEFQASHRFDNRMVSALQGYSPAEADVEPRRVPIGELRPGMILESDFWTRDGNMLIFKSGTTLTAAWIERIANFARGRAHELIAVRVPRAQTPI